MKIISISIVWLFAGSSTIANAASNFVQQGSCGSARVVSGDTCSNAKVELSFDSCRLQSEPKLADKILCNGKKITAKYSQDDLRYEVSFELIDQAGQKNWKQLSSLNQFVKESAVASEASEKKIDPESIPDIAVVPVKKNTAKLPKKKKKTYMIPAQETTKLAEPTQLKDISKPAESAAKPLKFSGFFDARFSNYQIKDDNSTASGNSESGFLIEDGALYLNYEKDNVSFLIDLPIRRAKVGDLNSAAANKNVSSNGNVIVGADKAQIYGKLKLSETFAASLGQFDTIYGVELNDSKDRIFGKTGLLYDSVLPVTHTGLLLEYSRSGFSTKAFAANSNNKGSLGDDASGDNSTEYGLAIGYSNDNFHIQLGGMTRPILKADGTERASRSLADIILGGTIGKFSADFEYSLLEDPSKNSLTPLDTSDKEKSGKAFLFLPTYKLSDSTLIGLRYENISDDPTSSSYSKVDSMGASIHYKYSAPLEFRLEYVNYSVTKLDETKFTSSRSNIAAIYLF